MADRDVVVVGAGPYGLASGARLRRAGIDVAVFGDVMSFWRRHMPEGMFLRSSGVDGCEIGEQQGSLTLTAFSADTGREVSNPLPIKTFVEYGDWYQKAALPELDPRLVDRVEQRNGGYAVTLADGETLTARRVVLAAGIDRFTNVPDALNGLDPALASHSTSHAGFAGFAGKSVAVIGAGQSALESAALLRESGADVELIVRGPSTRFLRGKRLREAFGPLSWLVYPPEDVGPPGINLLTARPHILRRLPRSTQEAIGRRAIKPAGAAWLADRVQPLRITLNAGLESAAADNGRVHLHLSDGTDRTVDHVMAATGFKVDVTKYPFLPEALLERVELHDGYPVLGAAFESSLPGLHFMGAPAAWSYGPLMRFVSGTWFASRALLRGISRNGRR